MSMFNDILAADAAGICAVDFGEAVIYTPSAPNATNPARTINVVIQRDPPTPKNVSPNYISPKMVLVVPNDQATGISSATMDIGGDTITVAYRPGTQAEAFKLRLPSGPGSMDAAMLTFELR